MNFDPTANRLLAALDSTDFALLQGRLRKVSLEQEQVLQQQEELVEHVYFPLKGVISLVSVMDSGEVVETATIGREGTLGAFGGLGQWRAFSRARVQIPGTAATMTVDSFQLAASQSVGLRNLILRYKEAQLAQVQQTAACNALHDLEQRLARWLLQLLDRVDDSVLPLTQEVIAQMLGVRRSSVTDVAGAIQKRGLIRYHRGRIDVTDRPKLEEAACECYRAIRRRTEAVFGVRA
jgi:CRP-like cAMP-binding protein